MKKRVTGLAALLLLLFAATAFAAAPREIGSADLLKIVSQAKGKVVIVNFFATWCPPCIEEIPGLIRIRTQYPADKVELLGVSVDENRSQLTEFMGRTPFNYPVFQARDELVRFFGISSIPRLLIYDTSGKLVIDNVGLVEPEDIARAIDTLTGGK